MAVAQQSIHCVGAHGFIDTNIIDAHRSQLYTDFYHQSQQPHTTIPAQKPLHHNSLLSDSVLAKYAPLGNLCKTVSQIGQSSSPSPFSLNSSQLTSPAHSELSPNKKTVTQPKSLNITSSSTSACKSPSVPRQIPPTIAAAAAAAKSTRLENMDSGMESSDDAKSETSSNKDENGVSFPAWIYCTRYSDRPSSGPRYRKPKTPKAKGENEEKRPRTAFSSEQLARLKVNT